MTSLYDVDKFDPPPDQELICCICTCVLDNAMESPCRHVYCKYCIETWLRQHRTCPTCRKKVSKRDLKPILPLVQNMLNKLTMICDFKVNGCIAKPMLEHYRSHVAKCGYEKVKCQFSKCRFVLLRRDLEDHEMLMCEFREIRCQQQCGLQIPFKDVESHNCMQALKEHAEERNQHAQELEKRLQELISVQESLRHDVEELRQRVEQDRSSSLDIDESTTSSWDFFDDEEDQNTTVFFDSDSDNDVLAGDSSLLASTSDNDSDGPEAVQHVDVDSGFQGSEIASTSNEPATAEDQATVEFVNEGEDTVNAADGPGSRSSQNLLPLSSQRKMTAGNLIDTIISCQIQYNSQQQSSGSGPISSGAATVGDQTSLGSHNGQAGRSPLHCPMDQLVVMETLNNGNNARHPTSTLSHSYPRTDATATSLFGSECFFGATTSVIFNESATSQVNPLTWPVIDNSSSLYPSPKDFSSRVLPSTSSNSNLLQVTSSPIGAFPLTLDVTSNCSVFPCMADSSRSAYSTERPVDRASTTREHSYSTSRRSSSSSSSVLPSATITSAQLEGVQHGMAMGGSTVGSADPSMNVEDVSESGGQLGSGQGSSVTPASKKRPNNVVMESTEPLVKNRRHDSSLDFSGEMFDQQLPNVNVNINLALLDITEFTDPPVAINTVPDPPVAINTVPDSFMSGIHPATSCAVISNQIAPACSRTAETCIVNQYASSSNPNCYQDTASSSTSKCQSSLPPQDNSYAINVTRFDQTTATASLECQRPRLPSATSGQCIPRSPSATSGQCIPRSPSATSGQCIQRSPSATSGQCIPRSLSATSGQRIPRSPSATSGQHTLSSPSAMALLGCQRTRAPPPANLVEDVPVPPSMAQLLSMYSGDSDSSWDPDHSDHVASDESSLASEAESDSSYEVRVPKPLSQLIEELAAISGDSDDSWKPE